MGNEAYLKCKGKVETSASGDGVCAERVPFGRVLKVCRTCMYVCMYVCMCVCVCVRVC